MNAKEEITKLIMASYDQGVADAKQEALAALEQIVALARADEREACAKVCEGWDFVPGGHEFTPQQLTKNLTDTIATQIRARSNT